MSFVVFVKYVNGINQVTLVFMSGSDRPGASWAVTLTVRLLVMPLGTALAWTPMETEWP